jgi:hypothetical protein
MANYLFLYSGGASEMSTNEAERAAIMGEWVSWFGQLGPAVVDGGNPFSTQARLVASGGTVSDIPPAVVANGYSVVKADSLDAAVEMAKGCPALKSGGQVSVYETFNVM